ncbi:hypothetical protein D3C85_1081600 [compost metagenome]
MEDTKVSASKSISAPPDIILKCVVPLGATIMVAGTNGAIAIVNSPLTRSIVGTNGAYKVASNFPPILNSKPCSNSASPSITFRKPLSLIASAWITLIMISVGLITILLSEEFKSKFRKAPLKVFPALPALPNSEPFSLVL